MKLNTINFHLTNRCNLLCKHCLYNSGKKLIDELKTPKILKIIKEFAKLSKNKGTVNLYGGETLLVKNIFKIIQGAQSENLQIGITTNVNVPDTVLKKLAKFDVSRITVDIDGGKSSTHDWLRNKKGHFDQSKKAIQYFLKQGKYVSVNSVLHKKNANEIEMILNLCKELGINSISFYLFTPLGRGWNIKSQVMCSQEWFAIKNRVINWVKENKPQFSVIWEKSYAQKKAEKERRLCDGFESQVLDVRCDGKVYFCGLLISVDGNSFGDLKKEKMENIIKKRKINSFALDTGCSALAIQNDIKTGKSEDMREKYKNIVPVCPYDWEILSGRKSNMQRKFVHVDDN